MMALLGNEPVSACSDPCKFCCIADSLDPLNSDAYCGTFFQCNPYVYLSSMIPALVCVIMLFLCVACCIKKELTQIPLPEPEDLRVEPGSPGKGLSPMAEADVQCVNQSTGTTKSSAFDKLLV